MEEMLFGILFAILEFLFEFALQLFCEYVWESVLKFVLISLLDVTGSPENEHPTFEFLSHVIVGAMFGALSLLVFPHPLMRSTHFHGISLLLSPLATGYAMAVIGRKMDEGGEPRRRFAKFQNGFAFALGMALVRFLFTR